MAADADALGTLKRAFLQRDFLLSTTNLTYYKIMKAVCWHGTGDVRIDTVKDPEILDPKDIIIQVTASGICGSDLHCDRPGAGKTGNGTGAWES